MSNIIQNKYMPDYVSPPGETLAEILEDREMSQAELAERMGRPKKTINEIIRGKAEITVATALELEKVLGTSARFWNEREWRYRESLARRKENDHLREQASSLKKFPYKKMIEFNWIDSYTDKVEQLKELLRFFAVASLEQLEQYSTKNLAVDFRKSQTLESDPFALIAWLRQGEIQASKIECDNYDKDKFKQALKKIRSLTTESIQVSQSEMVRLCAEAGVILVFTPQLPKARVSGATRWLTPNKALLQISDRYKKNDHFWFSFFHEAGHILLHGKRDTFIDLEKEEKNDKEKEADTFAANFLIDPNNWEDFLKSYPCRSDMISQFAKEIGIAPGIVVGRLQREHILDWSYSNELKESVCWS
jgi:addiction module HigA family antidote